MAIDSISLLVQAAAAYAKVNNQSTIDTNQTIRGSVDFQKMVNVEFNRFSSMTPEQILGYVNNIKSGESISSSLAAGSSGIVEAVVGEARKKLSAQENIITKSLIHEASLVDLVQHTADARNTLKRMVTIRDKFFDAWEKVLSMQI
jgi:flagellar hook-basal body complex protein FliE